MYIYIYKHLNQVGIHNINTAKQSTMKFTQTMMTSSNGNILFSALLAICAHKGQWRRNLMFSLIYARIIGWVNTGEAGDLRCHHAHYDVIVMFIDILYTGSEHPRICFGASHVCRELYQGMSIFYSTKTSCSWKIYQHNFSPADPPSYICHHAKQGSVVV